MQPNEQKKFGIIDSAKLFVVKERVCIFNLINLSDSLCATRCHRKTMTFPMKPALNLGKTARWNFNDDIRITHKKRC